MIISRRRSQWKTGWGKPLLRSALLYAGGSALAACAVLLGIAVFTEPGTGETTGTWLAVGMIVGCLAVGVVLTIMVTSPGWPTGLAGGVFAVGAAVSGWLVYLSMPDPGETAYIAHRHALAALAFGFGVVGGGLLVLGEMATDGKVPAPRWRPPVDMTVRVSVLAMAVVVVAAGAGAPAMHEWTDAANTDATSSGLPAPRPAKLDLARVGAQGSTDGGVGTPSGLLTLDETGEHASVAVTMRDAATGAERWHHRRWNRAADGSPVLSADRNLVALPGERRDDTTMRYVSVLDLGSGELRADVAFDGDPGRLRAVTSHLLVHAVDGTSLVASDYAAERRWQYKAPNDCEISTVDDDGVRVVVGLACRSDTDTKDRAGVVALDAATGQKRWSWKARAEGHIHPGGLVITPELVIADVRRDASPKDGMFAARKFRHDLNAIAIADGEKEWRRKNLHLGDTYAAACAGTLRLAGDDTATGSVLLGECHQVSGEAGATFDVAAYALSDGDKRYKAKAELGYAPMRKENAGNWFAGLPDGRVILAADASMDLNRPQCRLYQAGPDSADKDRLPVPKDFGGTDWCRRASLHVTPNSVAVSFPVKGHGDGSYFSLA